MLAVDSLRPPHDPPNPSLEHDRLHMSSSRRPSARTSSSRTSNTNLASTTNLALSTKPSIVSLSRAVKRIFRASSSRNGVPTVETIGDGISTGGHHATRDCIVAKQPMMGNGMNTASEADLRGRGRSDSGPAQRPPPPSSFLSFSKKTRPKSMQPPARDCPPTTTSGRPRSSMDGGAREGSSRLLELPPPVPPLPAKSSSDSGYGGSLPTSARLQLNDASTHGTPNSIPPRDFTSTSDLYPSGNGVMMPFVSDSPVAALTALPAESSSNAKNALDSDAVSPTPTPIASNPTTASSHLASTPASSPPSTRNETIPVGVNAAPAMSTSAATPPVVLSPLPRTTLVIPNLPPPPSSPRASTPRNQRNAHRQSMSTTTTSSLRLRLGADSLPPLLPNLPVIPPLTPGTNIMLTSSPSPESVSPGDRHLIVTAATYDGLPTNRGGASTHPFMPPSDDNTPFQVSGSGSYHPRVRSATTMTPSTSTSASTNGVNGMGRPHSNSISLMSGLASPRLVGGSTRGSYMVPMNAVPGTSTMPGGTTMKMTPSMVLRPPMTPQMKFPSLLLSGQITRGASSSAPPAPPEPADDDMEDDMDMDSGSDEDGHPADEMEEEEEHPASDDEDDMRTTTTHGIDAGLANKAAAAAGGGSSASGLGGVVKSIGSGLRSLGMPSSPAFLRTRTGSGAASEMLQSPSTPTPAPRSREASSSAALAAHRMSLVGMGAPAMGLHTTVEDDHVEDQGQQPEEDGPSSTETAQTPQTPNVNLMLMTPKKKTSISSTATEKAVAFAAASQMTPTQQEHEQQHQEGEPQARPRPTKTEITQTPTSTHQVSTPESHRNTLYHTPLATPSTALSEAETFNTRESTYFDAFESGPEAAGSSDAGGSNGGGSKGESSSAFATSFTSGSTSTLTPVVAPTRPVMTSSEPSAATIRAAVPRAVIPEMTSVADLETPARPSAALRTDSNGSGGSETSALGLDLSVGVTDPPEAGGSHGRASTTSELTNPASHVEVGTHPQPPTSARRWDDYFSSKTFTASPHEGSGLRREVSSRLSPRIPLGFGAGGLSVGSSSTPRTPGGRPVLYSHTSQSMIDLATPQAPLPVQIHPPQHYHLQSHHHPHHHHHHHQHEKSTLGLSSVIDSPAPTYKGKDREASHHGVAMEDGHTTVQPMKSPALSRRMSMPDMAALRAQPPPYPKYTPREDEGKEKLPPYSCRIHFEASVHRKMEFSGPGILSRDRAWKRVYIVLNGTELTMFKQNPRQHPIKPTSGGHIGGVYMPAGRRGDGVVDVEDVVVGAPHVHLPEDVLIASTSRMDVRPGLKKAPSRGSNGSGGNNNNDRRSSFDGSPAGAGPSASRRSLDTGMAHTRRQSAEMPGRRSSASASRSSLSSSGVASGSTAASSAGPSASEASLVNTGNDDPSLEKRSGIDATKASKSIIGDSRPSNSQSSNSRHGSQILASFQSNAVLRKYSLQNAETGLASDYAKRKFVIRVRADGEQFLIQADNILMAIDWIETFQAGANVALDLDERPMPKPPALPRRRRRRRTDANGSTDPNTNANAGGSGQSAVQPANGQINENAARRGNSISPPAEAASTPSQTDPPMSASSARSRFSFGRRRE
ncbi:hypothetical protein FRB97_007625 [Tulasnella sp. 331]|nr:hypothetical protein FRB97_007625 [Tulasnella sp. 331]